jgi:hypothetical protein
MASPPVASARLPVLEDRPHQRDRRPHHVEPRLREVGETDAVVRPCVIGLSRYKTSSFEPLVGLILPSNPYAAIRTV